MNLKIYKIILILTSFIFLNGFLVFIPLLGPGLTMATSGNIYKASIQYIVDRHIKNKTGKSSFSYVKQRMSKESIKVDLDADLKNLVENFEGNLPALCFLTDVIEISSAVGIEGQTLLLVKINEHKP